MDWEYLARALQEDRLRELEKARQRHPLPRKPRRQANLIQRTLAAVGIQLCRFGIALQRRSGEVEINQRPRSTSML